MYSRAMSTCEPSTRHPGLLLASLLVALAPLQVRVAGAAEAAKAAPRAARPRGLDVPSLLRRIPRVESWRQKGATGALKLAGTGTGIYLAREAMGGLGAADEHHILTNWHVVEGADALTLTFAHPLDPTKGLILDADLVAGQPDVDIALLRVRPSADVGWLGRPNGIMPLELGEAPELGARVATLGFEGGRMSIDKGTVRRPGKHYFHETDEIASFGNSGGPLLDAKGRVVGMTSQIKRLLSGRVPALHLPLLPIQAFLGRVRAKDVERDGTVQVASAGLRLRPVSLEKVRLARDNPDVQRRGILLPHDGPMVQVSGIVSGSAADQAGMEPGDIVLEAWAGEETVIPVEDDIVAAIQTVAPGGKEDVRLTVLRPNGESGKLIDITISGKTLEKRRSQDNRLLRSFAGITVEQVPLSEGVRRTIVGNNPDQRPGRFGMKIKKFEPEVAKEELRAILRELSGANLNFAQVEALMNGANGSIKVKDLLGLDLKPGDVIYQAVTDHGSGPVQERVETPEDLVHFFGHGIPRYQVIRDDRGEPRSHTIDVDPRQNPLGLIWFGARLQAATRSIPGGLLGAPARAGEPSKGE